MSTGKFGSRKVAFQIQPKITEDIKTLVILAFYKNNHLTIFTAGGVNSISSKFIFKNIVQNYTKLEDTSAYQ